MNASAPRIASLDALRGLAALTIVFHHYWFLAPPGSRPFEPVLGVVNEYGRLAVPLFYTLSGYIFFSVYGAAIAERRVDGSAFFWLRVSRLYPLQFVTLFVVAGLQAAALAATGHYFTYNHNDLLHFALNLTFLQYGWVDPAMSFNGPAWSLSIEAGLYLSFFVFARAFGMAARPRLCLTALWLALSVLRDRLPLSGPINPFIVEGLVCFFLGGSLQLTEAWREWPKLWLGLLLLALGAGLFLATGGRREAAPLFFAGLALTALGSAAFGRVAVSRPLAWLGDISYSTYLWHFPVQIALVVLSATVTPLNFSAPATLLVYVGLTLAISTLSFHYFETPARRAIRRWTTLAPARASASLATNA
jgi:peptidoglycan/LPS O-acetylase OafA/YrhL